jgi:hypothetical protein
LKLNPKYNDWLATLPAGTSSEKLMHKYWHFVDKPCATDAIPLPAIPTANAQERIPLFRSVLASNASDPLKSYDLSWLLHLVGDIYQPLHSSTRVDASNPGETRAGTW